MTPVRFPAAPLLAVWRREAIRQGYIGQDARTAVNPGEGFDTFCRVIGLNEEAYYRAKRTGWISIEMADRITCALGLHPILVWPAAYNAWQPELPDETPRDRRPRIPSEALEQRHLERYGHLPEYRTTHHCVVCARNRKRLEKGIPLDAPLWPRRKEAAA